MPLQKKLRSVLDKELQDIILFGSLVKGGSPRDIDAALILKSTEKATEYRSKVRLLLGEKADLQTITLDSIYSPIWLTLITEGFSIRKGSYLAELYHAKPMVLYRYRLTSLNMVQKVQFERGIKNVLGKEGVFLTRAVVLIPLRLKSRMMEFLKSWNIYYESQEYGLLPLLRKEEF